MHSTTGVGRPSHWFCDWTLEAARVVSAVGGAVKFVPKGEQLRQRFAVLVTIGVGVAP